MLGLIKFSDGHRADFDAWSRSMKRKSGFFAGLAFFKRDTAGGTVLVARHWPHLLCWQWLLGWSPGGKRALRFITYRDNNGRQFILILWFGSLRLSRQSSDWIPACRYRDIAPKVDWSEFRRATGGL